MRVHRKYRWNDDDYSTLLTALKTTIQRGTMKSVELIAEAINSSANSSFTVIKDCDQDNAGRCRSLKSIHIQLHRFNLAAKNHWMFSDKTGFENTQIQHLRAMLSLHGFHLTYNDVQYVNGNKKGDGSLTPTDPNDKLPELNWDGLTLSPQGPDLVNRAMMLFTSKSAFITHLEHKYSKNRNTIVRYINYKSNDAHPRSIPEWLTRECTLLIA